MELLIGGALLLYLLQLLLVEMLPCLPMPRQNPPLVQSAMLPNRLKGQSPCSSADSTADLIDSPPAGGTFVSFFFRLGFWPIASFVFGVS